MWQSESGQHSMLRPFSDKRRVAEMSAKIGPLNTKQGLIRVGPVKIDAVGNRTTHAGPVGQCTLPLRSEPSRIGQLK